MMQYELSDDEPELETLNISNDQYYDPLKKNLEPIQLKQPHEASLQIPKYNSKTIRHSLPAYDLWKALFPTYMSEVKYRNFHRPKLRHYNNGPQARNGHGLHRPHAVKNLSKNIFRSYIRLKNQVIQAINEKMSRADIMSKFLLIKHARELTAKDGELFFFEYCEEFPPLLSQVGMASNIRTYIYEPSSTPNNRPKGTKTQSNQQHLRNESGDGVVAKPAHGYVEIVTTEKRSKQIYYNALKRGVPAKFIENNLYRAPIFEHNVPGCDFLVIRTRNSFYIRQVQTIFTVGQEIPLVIVPAPNVNNIAKFRLDLSNIYIHKLFKASESDPLSLSLNKLLKLFPDYHRSVLQRRMTACGTRSFKTNTADVVVHKGTSSYGDLSITELRNYMRPEVYCTNMSMLAARQRLRELNYSESMIDPDKGQYVELEPEVQAAPWNTTKAVVHTMYSKCYLDLERHLIDPTGPAREGFSCVSWAKSPTEVEQSKQLSDARAGKQSIIPITFEKNPLSSKITREKLERLAIFQKEAQLIAQVQSNMLASVDNLSSADEESDIDEDNENSICQELNDLGKLIEGKTVVELSHEKEEEERRQMLADLRLNGHDKQEEVTQPSKKSGEFNLQSLKNKILMITRTYEQKNGNREQRTEIVRDPAVIALYVKQRGGTLADKIPEKGVDNAGLQCRGDGSLNDSVISNKSGCSPIQGRRGSLRPGEVCRAEGLRVIISKKLIGENRPRRKSHSHSFVDSIK